MSKVKYVFWDAPAEWVEEWDEERRRCEEDYKEITRLITEIGRAYKAVELLWPYLDKHSRDVLIRALARLEGQLGR